MGNDIKCGCKCQHSSQDDEVSFPSGLGKNNNSTYKSFEKIIIEDTFPEIESKINNNIEHSDDDKINIETSLLFYYNMIQGSKGQKSFLFAG